jgi:Mn-dependent DtxR family transcriptional regulator
MRVRRRELASVILLYKLHGTGKVNLGLVVDTLRNEMGVTRRTAVNIVKRLRKLGFLSISRDSEGLYVELRNPCSVLEEYAMNYVRYRRERALKSMKGLEDPST